MGDLGAKQEAEAGLGAMAVEVAVAAGAAPLVAEEDLAVRPVRPVQVDLGTGQAGSEAEQGLRTGALLCTLFHSRNRLRTWCCTCEGGSLGTEPSCHDNHSTQPLHDRACCTWFHRHTRRCNLGRMSLARGM